MAVTKQAKRAIRTSERKRVFNLRRSRAMKEAVKEVLSLAEQGNKKEAEMKLSHAYKSIDKARKQGVIKRNTAARKKSRLAKKISTL